MTPSRLSLNVIPLNIPEQSKQFSFFEHKPESLNTVPLNPWEMPVNLSDIHKEPLYTDFSTHGSADTTVAVDFDQSPLFAGHYLNHLIYHWFDGKARLRDRNFVRNNVLYFSLKDKSTDGIAVFDRYCLRGSYGRLTNGFELTVMYRGTMKVSLKPVYDYGGPTTDFSSVVYDGGVYRYDDLMRQYHVDRSTIYPVINREVAEKLQISRPGWKRINKIKRHTDKIDRFYNQFIRHDDFKKQFSPSEEGFMEVPEERSGRLDPDTATLCFGNGVTDRDPYSGIKTGGPYQPPAVSHIELFFIVAEHEKKRLGNPLYTYLKKGKGKIPGLSTFARMPLHLNDRQITFTDSDNPLPEIRQKLQKMHFSEEVTYGAIYISPIHKDDPDPEKHRVYYRLKEELLKYNVTSQVIHEASIGASAFGYYLPNISTAMTAKLGGIPWTLKQKTKKELIIGVGAYRPNRLRKRYLGSAFCFTNSGDFRGFNSFAEDDHIMLAGSFQKAIHRFYKDNNGMERLVIHFYKRMNRKESDMIKHVLKELDLDIPVVVLTIHKTRSGDLVLADRSKPHRLPLSGTWMRSGRNQFLLCTNTRFDDPDEKLRSHPYPIKVYIDVSKHQTQPSGSAVINRTDPDPLNDPDWVEELLEQVYQFSRLNWRSVSVKHLPVTVAYPEMVARKFPYFEGSTIPEFGKHNFWFL